MIGTCLYEFLFNSIVVFARVDFEMFAYFVILLLLGLVCKQFRGNSDDAAEIRMIEIETWLKFQY